VVLENYFVVVFDHKVLKLIYNVFLSFYYSNYFKIIEQHFFELSERALVTFILNYRVLLLFESDFAIIELCL